MITPDSMTCALHCTENLFQESETMHIHYTLLVEPNFKAK
jgi:hypothetical protein